MDNTVSPTSEFKNSRPMRPEVQASKKRSVAQKVVVTVKLGESDGKKKKSESPPSDCWSWRKYGQKPIKGSPHPRGYYRCSTSKGCSAKKQVERSRTDASVLIITYTASHNHPGPELPAATNFREEPAKESTPTSLAEDHPTTLVPERDPKMEQKTLKDSDYEDSFHYSQSPFNSSEDIIINPEDNLFTETLGITTNYDNSSTLLLDGEPLSYPHLMNFSTSKSEENDFYDELEELPPTSSFTSFFMRNSFFKDRVLVNFSGSL